MHAPKVHGVVFVVDATDRARIAVAREELHGILASRGTEYIKHITVDVSAFVSIFAGLSKKKRISFVTIPGRYKILLEANIDGLTLV